MKRQERIKGLFRSPLLLWDALIRGRYSFNYDMMPFTARNMSIGKRVNLVKSGLNLIHRRAKPWSMPLHIQAEVTNFCNLSCPICPTGTKRLGRPPQAMDVEVFESLMREVGPHLLTLTLWGWGEPLLHPKLREILRITRHYDVFSLLSTNGQTLNKPEIIEALLDEPPTHLIVALDGLTDETNSKYRVGAELAPALAGVAALAQAKKERGQTLPVLHMRYIAMRHNEHELDDLKAFAKEHQFDMLTLRTLSVIDTDIPDSNNHSSYVPEKKGVKPYEYSDGKRVKRDDFICQEPFWFPSVFADGTVVACEQDSKAQLPFGKLSTETSFCEIWQSRQAGQVRKRIRDCQEDLSFCRNCPYRDRNDSNCSIKAHFFNDAIDHARLPIGGGRK